MSKIKCLFLIFIITLFGLLNLNGTVYTENFDTAGNWALSGAAGNFTAKTYTTPSAPGGLTFSTNYSIREDINTNSAGYAFRIADRNYVPVGPKYLEAQMNLTDITGFSMNVARWDNSPIPYVTVEYSVDGGTVYTTLKTFTSGNFPIDKAYVLFFYTFATPISPDLNKTINIRFTTTAGARMLYDDFTVYYANENPPALSVDFTANKTAIPSGSSVTFINKSIWGTPDFSYAWTFGDGSTSTVKNPTHIYNSAGDFTVSLTVTDGGRSSVLETKTGFIKVHQAVAPVMGSLFISEVCGDANTDIQYIELYNNSADVLSLENIKLLMLNSSNNIETTFKLNNPNYTGDMFILPYNYIIITREGTKSAFEAKFGVLPEGVSFLRGSSSMNFGVNEKPRRWQLVDDVPTTIDDTLSPAGGGGNTSYQSSDGVWVYTSSTGGTPGASHQDQTLPVTLTSFMAVQTADNYAKITWNTESETSLTGYNIYRNVIKDHETATRVNSTLIMATNSNIGCSYSYVDDMVTINKTYYYWLQINEFCGSASFHGPYRIRIEENNNQSVVIPLKTTLRSIYPNPFNPTTSVSFYMEKQENIQINIYNIRGQLITNLINDSFAKGFHNVMWNGQDANGNDCASGVYFFRMETKNDVQMIKGILMK